MLRLATPGVKPNTNGNLWGGAKPQSVEKSGAGSARQTNHDTLYTPSSLKNHLLVAVMFFVFFSPHEYIVDASVQRGLGESVSCVTAIMNAKTETTVSVMPSKKVYRISTLTV